MEQIPVYAFTGFLDSGKTKFIQETLEDPRFNAGERTLVLIFEEGEEEYDLSAYPHKNVYLETLDQQTVTEAQLTALEKKYRAERVVAELNGMQLVADLYNRFPRNWVIAQEVMFADATTFNAYNSNMRNLVMDKLMGAQMVVFNRLTPGEDTMPLHKLARAANRRIDILYDYTDGTTKFDDVQDPLPFDINAPVIEIPEEFFGVWYMDCMDDPKKYDGKTVKYLAQVCQTPQAGKGAFVPGRFAMTCCVQDIQFVGMPCKYDDYKSLEQRSWITITAKINVKYHPIYKGQTPDSTGPVLTALSVEPAEKPAQDVVMFS